MTEKPLLILEASGPHHNITPDCYWWVPENIMHSINLQTMPRPFLYHYGIVPENILQPGSSGVWYDITPGDALHSKSSGAWHANITPGDTLHSKSSGARYDTTSLRETHYTHSLPEHGIHITPGDALHSRNVSGTYHFRSLAITGGGVPGRHTSLHHPAQSGETPLHRTIQKHHFSEN